VFIAARRGDFDAVVSMYHDQGQIAMKLMGFERGVTLHGGLPVPVATPASGSAYAAPRARHRRRRHRRLLHRLPPRRSWASPTCCCWSRAS
jgi:hypothetical protein